MIEDVSTASGGRRTTWSGPPLRPMPSFTAFTRDAGKEHVEQALIVYQNAKKPLTELSEVNELLLKARVVLPAVMNYLYFGSSQVAVVYFGKRVSRRGGVKHGIRDGAQDLKIRLMRYFTSEMWPPLLRADAPDESLGYNEALDSCDYDHGGSLLLSTSAPEMTSLGNVAAAKDEAKMARIQSESAQERLWFRRSVENHMQVLLYLKNSTNGKSKYLKVVLQNRARRLHFDITESKEEKYRWELRMLFTRIMDNLETQRAIDSYESYVEYFRVACATAAKYALFLERPRQPMLEVVLWTKSKYPAALQEEPENPVEAEEKCSEDDAALVITAVPKTDVPPHVMRRSHRSGTEEEANDVVQPQVLNRRCSSQLAEWAVLKVCSSHDGVVPEAASGAVCTSRRPLSSDAPAVAAQVVPPAARRSGPPTPILKASSALLSPRSLGTRECSMTPERGYPWMSRLPKPESTTLDYKSYFFRTALEIRRQCVKFMCGFLNAYGEGRLIIGVHEIPRGSPANAEERKELGQTIVLHNDLVDQFVVGARVSVKELEDLQVDVSEQLLCCIPPIPPRAVQVDAVPVRFPPDFSYASRILILYDFANPGVSTREALKQKSNYAIRYLFAMGLSIVPLDLPACQTRELLITYSADAQNSGFEAKREGANWDDVNAEVYLVAALDNAAALNETAWEEKLTNSLNRHKQRCHHAIIDYEPAKQRELSLPELFVLEVSVNIKRCVDTPLIDYRGKFFAGWPSIPVWDPTTQTVRAVERNYNLLAGVHSGALARRLCSSGGLIRAQCHAEEPCLTSGTRFSAAVVSSPLAQVAGGNTTSAWSTASLASPSRTTGFDSECGLPTGLERQVLGEGWAWFLQANVMARILDFLYNPLYIRDILQFRLIHPLGNVCFENRQGNYLMQMICSTPVGVPIFNAPHEQISRIQYSFLHAGLPPLPLLLCHCYETIGNLPSPYPFVAVPLVQQTFRVAPCLVPLFYRQHYFDGQLRLAVVLDLRDSLLKTVEMRHGNLLLDAVVGIGFEPMNKRQVMRHFLRHSERLSGSSEGGEQASESATRRRETLPSSKRVMEEDPEEDVLTRQSFVARRAFRPQAMTTATESLPVSPRACESAAMIDREVEADIPLLHFRFLTRKAVEEGRFLTLSGLSRGEIAGRPPTVIKLDERKNKRGYAGVSAREGSVSGTSTSTTEELGDGATPGSSEWLTDTTSDSVEPFEAGMPVAHGRPWTLPYLLYWYHSFLTDREHYSVFGCGNRSIAFRVTSLSEVCTECVDAAAVEAMQSHISANKNSPVRLAPDRMKCALHRKVREWLLV